jgi:hypothetical protein
MGNNRKRLITLVVIVIIIAAVLLVGAQLSKHPRVRVVVPQGADTVLLDKVGKNNSGTTTKVTSTSRVTLETGQYAVTYQKDGRAITLTTATVHAGFTQTIDHNVSQPSSKLDTFMHQHARLVTPLGKGYIYVNTENRAIEYMDNTGITDLSQSLLLTQTPADQSDVTYNTPIAIQPTKDGSVLVTTTVAIFLVKNPSDITSLRSSSDDFLNFTSSSYDAKTNKVFALSSYERKIYSYDLNKPEDSPKVFYKTPKDVNRVSAGGGKVATYFDDVPSVESTVLASYSKTKQLAPLIIDASSAKLLKTLDDWQGTTLLSVSPNGNYVAVKKKFATSMTILGIDTDKSVETVAPDTNTVAWQGDTLYFARDKSLWRIKPGESSDTICAATASSDINSLIVQGDTITATTVDGFAGIIVPNSTASDNLADGLRDLKLSDNGYYISYLARDGKAVATIDVKGQVTLGEDASPTPDVSAPAQAGLAALGAYAKNSAVTVKQRDTTIVRPYQFAGIPTD